MSLGEELEVAHRHAVRAAFEGLRDAHLGPLRLTGPGVPVLAESAVTSATPFVRAPLLGRMRAAALLHTPEGGDADCPACGTPYPCPTVEVLTP